MMGSQTSGQERLFYCGRAQRDTLTRLGSRAPSFLVLLQVAPQT
jgi:hypothetical protein